MFYFTNLQNNLFFVVKFAKLLFHGISSGEIICVRVEDVFYFTNLQNNLFLVVKLEKLICQIAVLQTFKWWNCFLTVGEMLSCKICFVYQYELFFNSPIHKNNSYWYTKQILQDNISPTVKKQFHHLKVCKTAIWQISFSNFTTKNKLFCRLVK
jgi:hypothetical protein